MLACKDSGCLRLRISGWTVSETFCGCVGDFIQITLRRFHLPLPYSPKNGPEIWELGKGQGWDAIA